MYFPNSPAWEFLFYTAVFLLFCAVVVILFLRGLVRHCLRVIQTNSTAYVESIDKGHSTLHRILSEWVQMKDKEVEVMVRKIDETQKAHAALSLKLDAMTECRPKNQTHPRTMHSPPRRDGG